MLSAKIGEQRKQGTARYNLQMYKNCGMFVGWCVLVCIHVVFICIHENMSQ